MTNSSLSALLFTLFFPLLLACGQGSGQETAEAASDTAEAAVAETPAEAEQAETPAQAERQAPAPATTRQVRSAPAGTRVWATLLDSLDSESAEADDRFSAEVSSAVTDGTHVLVPAGSRLHGRMTEVRPARGSSAAGGAAAGTAIALRTQAEYAVLPAGSEIILELDEALEIRMPVQA